MKCPCENESPDPCPICGATVSGDDPVNGVCQATIIDDRVRRAGIEAMREAAVNVLAVYEQRARVNAIANKDGAGKLWSAEHVGYQVAIAAIKALEVD